MAAWAMPLKTCCTAFVLALLWRARMLQPIWSSLHGYLLLSAFVLVTWRTVDLISGQVNLRAYGQAAAHWPQLMAVALRVAVWLSMAVAVDLAMPDEAFRYHGESRSKSWIAAGVLVLTAALPRKRRWEPGDLFFGVLFVVIGFDVLRALSDRSGNALDVAPPFDRPIYVLNGGAGPLVNEHARHPGWTGAIDLFLLTSGGQVCAGQGLAAFPCFGAPVLAPVSGRIANVVRDRPDMSVGTVDEEVPTGNSLSIQTSDGRYLLLAHLEHSTILVKEGDRVTVGQELARCGNSGTSRLPHLLLQAQDRPEPLRVGQEGSTFSLRFVNTLRLRREDVQAGPITVRRNDVIEPLILDEMQ
jgi:murein DD-endopeptidase MepM/ murein hydrolase activator NlpD